MPLPNNNPFLTALLFLCLNTELIVRESYYTVFLCFDSSRILFSGLCGCSVYHYWSLQWCRKPKKQKDNFLFSDSFACEIMLNFYLFNYFFFFCLKKLQSFSGFSCTLTFATQTNPAELCSKLTISPPLSSHFSFTFYYWKHILSSPCSERTLVSVNCVKLCPHAEKTKKKLTFSVESMK